MGVPNPADKPAGLGTVMDSVRDAALGVLTENLGFAVGFLMISVALGLTSLLLSKPVESADSQLRDAHRKRMGY